MTLIYDQCDSVQDLGSGSKPPRAVGTGHVVIKSTDRGPALADLRMSGCTKLLFPRARTRLDAMVLNTAGGLTSGDRIDLSVDVRPGAACGVTTQAAERAYRAMDEPAQVTSLLSVGAGAGLFWMPQELIIFDHARLHRSLTCDLASTSKALLVEPVVFGRQAMGERLSCVDFRDSIRVTRDACPLFSDVAHVQGDGADLLCQPALAMGMGAMVTLVYVAPDAEAKKRSISPYLDDLCGTSLVQSDVLVLRALAQDSLALRRMLLPVLDVLTDHTLPVSWRL